MHFTSALFTIASKISTILDCKLIKFCPNLNNYIFTAQSTISVLSQVSDFYSLCYNNQHILTIFHPQNVNLLLLLCQTNLN